MMAFLTTPSLRSSSSQTMIQSIATSQSFRVRYPASAVLRAVSASPFRAPCVDIKYSKTDNPSRNEARIGCSIISPEGIAINPRIPHNCLTCWRFPRAPESINRYTGFIVSLPKFSSRHVNASFAISSVAEVQTSIILLCLSPLVIIPFLN